MKQLTQRQENFCLNFVKHGNGTKAYRESYSCENQKEATINNSAYKLLNNPDIKARIEQLNQKAEKASIITLEQRKELLSRFAWEEESDKAMKAIDLLNKMESIYTIKQDITANGSITIAIPEPKEDL